MKSLLTLLLTLFTAPTWAAAGTWLEVPIGIIGPASEDVLNTAIEERAKHGYDGLILIVDTPGGALENTRAMVKSILGADYPVLIWVGPGGSRAGSAGAFITLAGHVAAMAPGTNIGAAHPIGATGEDVPEGEAGRKITNDTIAFIESVAKARGRNVDMARSFVSTSVSITESEALEHKVVDFVVKDVETLLKKVDGREVTLESGTKVVLATSGAVRKTLELSLRQRLLSFLSNPNLFYLLFMAGLIGIGYELTHPGAIFPGVVGGICMILALIATSVLPISWGAAALILLGVALLVAEAFVPSFGTLGIGGMVALVLGSVFLVDPSNESGLRVSLYAIAPVALTVGGAFLALGFIVVRAERAPVHSGAEGLIGATATALAEFQHGQGQVRVQGAIWTAKAATPVPQGESLVVTAIEGLVLIVKPLS
jgi:membrane-bound serine protease (ClpP class)